MKKPPPILRVKPHDDIVRIARFAARHKFQDCYIVVPEDDHLFRNSLNLKLLAKQLEGNEQEIIIVTSDRSIARTAQKNGFSAISELPPQFKEDEEIAEAEDVLVEEKEQEERRVVSHDHKKMPMRKMYDIIPPGEAGPEPQDDEAYVGQEEEREEQDTDDLYSTEEEVSEDEAPEDRKHKERLLPRKKKAISLPSLPNIKRSMGGIGGLFVGLTGFRLLLKFFAGKAMWAFMAVALVLGLIVLFMVIPRVKVTIIPLKEIVKFEVELIASTKIAVVDEDGNIPAQLVFVEKNESQEYISSGEEEREEKSRGTITVYNEFSSSSQTLIENTRFVSQDGKVFRTRKTIVIPGATLDGGKIIAASIDVEVLAAEPGKDFNIGSSTFSIPGFKGTPKYTAFYGKSAAPMTGGSIGKVTVVTKEDIEKAKADLRSRLTESVKEEFNKKLPEGFVLRDEALEEEVGEFTVDQEAGYATKSFTVSGSMIIKAILFSEADVQAVVQGTISRYVADNLLYSEDFSNIKYSNIESNFAAETLLLSINVEESLARSIDIEQIREDLKGKDEIEVRRYFGQREDIDTARVVFFPRFLVRKVPNNIDKIEVVIEEE